MTSHNIKKTEFIFAQCPMSELTQFDGISHMKVGFIPLRKMSASKYDHCALFIKSIKVRSVKSRH